MSIAEEVRRKVMEWPEVEDKPHRFNEVAFWVRGHERGHLHGDGWADLPLPALVRNELVAEGKARPHHTLPETWWVSHPIRVQGDLQGSLGLFRLNYERITSRKGGRATEREGGRA